MSLWTEFLLHCWHYRDEQGMVPQGRLGGSMTISNKRTVLVSTGLGACIALVAAVAQAQDVSFEPAL